MYVESHMLNLEQNFDATHWWACDIIFYIVNIWGVGFYSLKSRKAHQIKAVALSVIKTSQYNELRKYYSGSLK